MAEVLSFRKFCCLNFVLLQFNTQQSHAIDWQMCHSWGIIRRKILSCEGFAAIWICKFSMKCYPCEKMNPPVTESNSLLTSQSLLILVSPPTEMDMGMVACSLVHPSIYLLVSFLWFQCIFGPITQGIDLKLGGCIHYETHQAWLTFGRILLNSHHFLDFDRLSNFHHKLHWKLSFWQLSMQPMMKTINMMTFLFYWIYCISFTQTNQFKSFAVFIHTQHLFASSSISLSILNPMCCPVRVAFVGGEGLRCPLYVHTISYDIPDGLERYHHLPPMDACARNCYEIIMKLNASTLASATEFDFFPIEKNISFLLSKVYCVEIMFTNIQNWYNQN